MDDKKIAAAIQGRDEQMLAFAMRKYARLLWKTAAAVLVNADSAQDVEECVADAFLYLWQNPEKYDPAQAKLSSWLCMVARSRAIDRYRKNSRKREVSLEEIPAIAVADAAGEGAGRLRECMGRLGAEEKELLLRRYYYGQKPAEIAAALDVPKKQVENRLYYVKKKLRSIMEEG